MSKKGFVYTALGFPVILLGARFKKVRGIEVPDINLNTLQKSVFEALIDQPFCLTGAEIRFIRSYLQMTQDEFGKILNQSSHSIVSQWEKKGLKVTGMDNNTELWLRLHMAKTLRRLELTRYVETFLEKNPIHVSAKPEPLEIDIRKAA